jgi:Family of unknown function (DUF5308)
LAAGRDIVELAREDLRPLSGTTENTSIVDQRDESGVLVNGTANGGDYGTDLEAGDEAQITDEDGVVQLPPLLVATVVASGAGETLEARRAAARLERMGREFQKEFMREETEPRAAIAEGEDGWGRWLVTAIEFLWILEILRVGETLKGNWGKVDIPRLSVPSLM